MKKQGIINGEDIFVFHSSENVKNKHDATGAFIPEAKKFAKLHGVPNENVFPINCVGTNKNKRRNIVFDALNNRMLDRKRKLKSVVFFMHGMPKFIQCGIGIKHIPLFAIHLQNACDTNVKISLYTCLTAENELRDNEKINLGPATDGGFADELRDEMARQGIIKGWVDGHKTAGHTSWNPMCVRFRCDAVKSELYGAVGGFWIVQPGSDMWKKWVKRIKGKTGFRFRYPYMTQKQIIDELYNSR